jgi:hypothetical protein
MKKIMCVLAYVMLIAGGLAAQEQAESAPQEQAPAQPQEAAPAMQMPEPKPNVISVFGMGELRIDGMILTGITAKKDTKLDEDWRLGFLNPTWQENRFELDLHYSSGELPGGTGMKFGFFSTIWSQNYGIGNFTWNELPTGANAGTKMGAPDWNQPWIELRYAGLWFSALNDKVKMTIGRTYDEFYYMPESKVWKTEGYGNAFRFTDEKYISLRMEFKPVKGLNFGFQWFALPAYAGDEAVKRDVEWPKLEEAIKEIGIAAEYKTDLFNTVGGVRFDSNADPIDRYEARTYLSPYYGDGGNSLRLWNYPVPTAYLPSGATSGYSHQGPYYKHLDEVTTVDSEGKLRFADGAWAFFGFNFKGVKNLTAMVHGGLYNITAFDKFGYGSIAETIGYTINKLGFGVNMVQQFYGSDVFGEKAVLMDADFGGGNMPLISWDIVNSPYFQFIPYVSYNVLPMGMLSVKLEGNFGVCKDVLDVDWGIKPSIGLRLGSIVVDISYQFTRQEYTNPFPASGMKQDVNTHLAGIGFMMVF